MADRSHIHRLLRGDAATSTSPSPAEETANLASVFFQASLIPYLLFLYFLNYQANQIPILANFGFQFLLVFVAGTVVAGILAKNMYNASLANVDWIHGSAESLLTISNVLIVMGFKDGMTEPHPSVKTGVSASLICAVFLVLFVSIGARNGFDEHDHFLWGIGNLKIDSIPWTVRDEPNNALSIATWTIHIMSVIEYVVAMNMVWKFARTTENPRWKGLTWGMLPMHASSICALTHHFFYNTELLLFLVDTQGFLTLFGNITTMVAAQRIAKSNGWTMRNLPSWHYQRAVLPQPSMNLIGPTTSNSFLLLQLVASSVFLSYIIKYGELAFSFPATPNASVAVGMTIAVPTMTASYYMYLSNNEECSSNEDEDVSGCFFICREDETSPLV